MTSTPDKQAWPSGEELLLVMPADDGSDEYLRDEYVRAASSLTGCPQSDIRIKVIPDSEVDSTAAARAWIEWEKFVASPAYSSRTPYVTWDQLWPVL